MPVSRIEHHRGDLRAGGIAGFAQPLGERDVALGELVHAVLADAVVVGLQPGQDRGVRGQRARHGGLRLLEQHAALGQLRRDAEMPRSCLP